MVWVAAEGAKGNLVAAESGKTALGSTRNPEALAAFQHAAAEILARIRPDVVAIKEKPETGRMRAGAAALKMEALLMAGTECVVDVVSGRRVNALGDIGSGLKAYQVPAFAAALAAAAKG